MKFLKKHLKNTLRHGIVQNRLNPNRGSNISSIVGLMLLATASFGALFSLRGSNAAIGDTSSLIVDKFDSPEDELLENSATSPGRRAQVAEPKTTTTRTIPSTKDSGASEESSEVQEQEQDYAKVECQIDEFHGIEEAGHAKGNKGPVVLRGVWEPPNEDWKAESGFLRQYGDVPFYIKDNFVQVKNEKCIAPFQDLWRYISSPGNDKLKRSMLAFTNDKENPTFFGETEGQEKMDYAIPNPVKHIDSFTIVSTMTKGQSHEMHRHGESWIGQAAGHKMWWFLPPHHKPPQKINACDYMMGKASPPKGTTTCIQSPGDVIWFPDQWFHATCSLTEWNVALGRQLGPRINQKFKTLPSSVDPAAKGKMQQTLRECSGAAPQSTAA